MTLFDEFDLRCPECEADPEEANLKVVSFTFEGSIPLARDGFDMYQADEFSTDDEKVRCEACDGVFDLENCKYRYWHK